MAEPSGAAKPMIIEGYQVFSADGPQVKEEPVDTGYQESPKKNRQNGPAPSNGQSSPEKTAEVSSSGDSSRVREMLKQLVENRGKDLTVKSVVEDLLQKNELVLSQNEALPYKPNTRNPKPKNSEPSAEGQSSISLPKDPTNSCSIQQTELTNINEALVEVAVNNTDSAKFDTEFVCAVGSKIILMTPKGQPLQMDITCYWCNFCSYRSDKKESLLQHVMEHRFHCKYCKYQSFSRAAVIHHCKEEHESFAETANTLKYCTYLPDYLQGGEQNKKRQRDQDNAGPTAKIAKTSEPELNMDVEEIDESAAPSSSTDMVITPRRSARRSAPTVVSPVVTTNAPPQPASPVPELVPVSEPEPVPEEGMPVITNVVSGEMAVSAGAPNAPEVPGGAAGSVTVSSGLCWNCGYCGFVTLSQAYLKIHLNAQHNGKAHKYVAMLVSSEDEMVRIKASDAQLVSNPTTGTGVAFNQTESPAPTLVIVQPAPTPTPPPPPPPPPKPVTPTPPAPPTHRSTLPAPKPSTSAQIEIDNAETDTVKTTGDDEEDEKKIPVSFKCAHCNFSSPQTDKVKSHLLQRHVGSVIYSLDMKAVKMRQKRYVFFCLKSKCSFYSKEPDDFMEHVDTCTPWLDGNDKNNIEAAMIKSLDLTRQFLSKIGGNQGGSSKDTKQEKSAEYGCIYCSYISNNNTRLKKHVLSNHTDRNSIIKDLQAANTNRKHNVYFCRHCLWESRDGSELELHLKERHNDTNPVAIVTESSSTTTSTTTSSTARPSTSSPSAAKPAGSVVRRAAGWNRDSNRDSSSSKESSPASSSPATSESEDEDLDYTGVVPEHQIEKAMAIYVAAEANREGRARGRPTREAAIRAQAKVRSVVKTPTLFECLHCDEVQFGVKLARNHIRKDHKNKPLRAIDVMRKHRKHYFYTCFCPQDGCGFCHINAQDVVNHGKKEHALTANHQELIRLVNVFIPPTSSDYNRPSTAATGESYECLYCATQFVCHSRKDMKKHLQSKHETEDFLYRDCIARKLKQLSRHYMCKEITCEFTTEKQKDYSLHLLGHQKAKIYECSKCQWFTANPDMVADHMLNVHNGESITSLQIDLDIDSSGNVVKLVGGQVIKTERH